VKVSFHKTFLHFLVNQQKNTSKSNQSFDVFSFVNSTFLKPTKKRSWLCFNRALIGLSRLLPGWMGHVVFHVTDLSSPGGYDSFSPRPKLQSKGRSAGFFGMFWSWGVWGWQKKHIGNGNKIVQNSVLYTYIYWCNTQVMNTHIVDKMDFWSRINSIFIMGT